MSTLKIACLLSQLLKMLPGSFSALLCGCGGNNNQIVNITKVFELFLALVCFPSAISPRKRFTHLAISPLTQNNLDASELPGSPDIFNGKGMR